MNRLHFLKTLGKGAACVAVAPVMAVAAVRAAKATPESLAIWRVRIPKRYFATKTRDVFLPQGTSYGPATATEVIEARDDFIRRVVRFSQELEEKRDA